MNTTDDTSAADRGSALSEGLGAASEALHAAACQAVALLNRAPELARSPEGREAHHLLRQALVDYADRQPRCVASMRGSAMSSPADLHAAVCQAITLLNTSPEVARCTEGRQARDILRQALSDYADAYMDQPATDAERDAVARKHRTRRK